MARLRLPLMLLGILAGASALRESSTQLVTPDTTGSNHWQHLCSKLGSGRATPMRVRGATDAGASFTATYHLASCKGAALWSARLDVTGCDACDAEALRSEVSGLSVLFDQAGETFDRLHTTKNGRAAPPLSAGARALCAAAARAITARHAAEEQEQVELAVEVTRASRRLLQETFSAGPNQVAKTCTNLPHNFTVTVTRGSAVDEIIVELPTTLTDIFVEEELNADGLNKTDVFKFVDVPFGSHTIKFIATGRASSNITTSVTLNRRKVSIAVEGPLGFYSSAPSENPDTYTMLVAKQANVPTTDKPTEVDVYVVMSEFMAAADVLELNATALPSTDPACTLVSATGIDLLYRCKITAASQTLTFSALGETECTKEITVVTQALDLAVTTDPEAFTPSGPLCRATDKWETDVLPGIQATKSDNAAANAAFAARVYTADYEGCVFDAVDNAMDCEVAVGVTPVTFTVSAGGFSASAKAVFNVNASDYTIDATIGGVPRRAFKLSEAKKSAVTVVVKTGKDVPFGATGDLDYPEDCVLLTNSTSAAGSTYSFNCSDPVDNDVVDTAGVSVGRTAFDFTATSETRDDPLGGRCLATSTAVAQIYVDGAHPLTLADIPEVAFDFCQKTQEHTFDVIPQISGTGIEKADLTLADITSSNPACKLIEDATVLNPKFECKFPANAGNVSSIFSVTLDGVTRTKTAKWVLKQNDYSMNAYMLQGGAKVDESVLLLPAAGDKANVTIKVDMSKGVTNYDLLDAPPACVLVSMANVTGGNVTATFTCEVTAVGAVDPNDGNGETDLDFELPGLAGTPSCVTADTFKLYVAKDRGYKIDVNPAYEVDHCAPGQLARFDIPVTLTTGDIDDDDGELAIDDLTFASRITGADPEDMDANIDALCTRARYTKVATTNPKVLTWVCKDLPLGTYDLKWSVMKHGNMLSNSTQITVRSFNYTIAAVPRKASLAVTAGSTADFMIDVTLGGDLTEADVLVNNTACAFSSKVDEDTYLFVCKALPAGRTPITFTVDKPRCSLTSQVVLAVSQGTALDTAPVVDLCKSCKACMTDMLNFTTYLTAADAEEDSATNAAAAAAAFSEHCTDTKRDATLCTLATRNVLNSNNGNFGRRPAALCYALKECSPSIDCPMMGYYSSNKTVNFTASLDACTKNGLKGDDAVPAAAPPAEGTCGSDLDCANMNMTFTYCKQSAAGTAKTCTCDTLGFDSCKLRGMCEPVCEAPKIVAYMAAQNALLPLCNITGNTSTCADEATTCVPFAGNARMASKCFTLACENATITSTPCSSAAGMCLPERKITKAQFAADRRSILVSLNLDAAPAEFDCDKVFDAKTSELLGAGAFCVAEGAAMTVHLTPAATIKATGAPTVNDTLMFDQAQSLLIHDLSGLPFNSNVSIALDDAETPAAPVVILTVPSVFTLPCGGGPAPVDLVFDASSSYDPSGRPLTQVTWSLGIDESSDPSPVINALLAANMSATASKFVIPAANVSSLTVSSYVIRAEITNDFGAKSFAEAQVEVKAAGQAPIVTIVGSGAAPRAVSIKDGFKLTSSLVAESVCAGDEVTYAWDSESAKYDPAVAAVPTKASKTLIMPGPLAGFVDGDAGVITLTAGITDKDGDDQSSTASSISVVARASPLVAAVKGPSDFSEAAAIVISAAGSFDPMDPKSLEPLAFEWACVTADNKPCFATANRGNVAGAVWTIPAGLLTTGVSHTFTVTVSKISTATGTTPRIATASWSGVRPVAADVPTATIKRACAGPCPPKHAASKPIAVELAVPAAFEAAAISWTVNGAPVEGAKGLSLTIPAASIPANGDVAVTAELSLDGKTGSASLVVPINKAPYCKAASCLVVEAKAGDAFPQQYVASVPLGLIADDDGAAADLTFEWGVRGAAGDKPLLIDAAPSFRFAELPAGESSIYVRATDAMGAKYEATAAVDVPAAPEGFDAAAAVAAIDPAQAKRTGDPAAISSAVRSLTLLAGVGPAANATEAEVAAFKAAVNARLEALLGAGAEMVDSADLQAAQTAAATAAAALGAIAYNQTAVAKQALALGVNLITAAQLSGYPLPAPAAAAGIALMKAAGPKAALPTEDGAWRARAAVDYDEATQRNAAELMRGMVDSVATIGELLAAGAAPADGPVSAGAAGVTLAVAAAPARALDGLVLPVSAASVVFAGPHVAPCSTLDAEGAEVVTPCPAGTTTVTAQYHRNASLFTAVRTSVNLGLVSAVATTTTVPTGAVVLSAAGADPATGAFACAEEGACSASVRLPLPAAAAPARRRLAQAEEAEVEAVAEVEEAAVESAGFDYACVRMESNTVFAAAGVPTIDETTEPPTAVCETTRVGTYLVTSTPRAPVDPEDPLQLQEGETAFTAPAATRPYAFNMRFLGMDFAAISTVAATATRTQFRDDLAAAVAAAAGVPKTSVQIGVLTAGSVRATVTVHVPEAWTPAQVQAMADAILADPASIFSAEFMAAYNITGVEASLSPATPLPAAPAPPAAGLSAGAQAGIAIGVIAGVAAIAGGGYFVWQRRRRMAAQAPPAFDGMGGAAYAAPQTGSAV
ncbi:MAG: hypothetical protein J3K34DRAFT_489498 [Monoraphidium minutum]|nr:MAG: hypothetical protein J3K34DRAFT_489498 [Monoraphidium minutum]